MHRNNCIETVMKYNYILYLIEYYFITTKINLLNLFISSLSILLKER